MGISQVRFDFFAYSVRMFRNRKSIGIPVCFSKLAARFHHICRKRQQILQSRAGPISDSSKTQPVFWWFCRNQNKFPVQYLHYPTDRVQYHWSVFTENMRKEERRYMKKERQNTDQEALFEAILTLRSPEECYAFFKDLCTYQELNAMAQRLQVAKMLHEGHVFHEIVEETGASTATISRVNRAIKDGCDGYQIIFDRTEKTEEK